MIPIYRDIILLTIIALSLLIASIMIYLNNRIIDKIKYYESSEGILARALNKSLEKEYYRLKNISTYYYIIGLGSILITIGGIGVYIDLHRNRDEYEIL